MLEEKTIHFANFNITFGENEEAMLMHFEDIIIPCIYRWIYPWKRK